MRERHREQREERFRQWLRVLDEVSHSKDKRLEMDVWYECGTVACAAGWAASDPWFHRRGLRLIPLSKRINDGHCVRFSDGSEAYHAIANFFRIEQGEAQYLCNPFNYKSFDVKVSTVKKRIQKFIDDGYTIK